MPAPKMYLTTHDIAGLNGICLRTAQYMMRMFTNKGLTVSRGLTPRGRRVDIDTYVKYMCDQDGSDPKRRKENIREYLKEAKKDRLNGT